MLAHKAPAVQLSAEHERELSELERAHSTPQKQAERARVILLAAAGLAVGETARQLGIWRKTADHWRRRWRDAAASADVAARLSVVPRCGAPATFMPEAICQIMALACKSARGPDAHRRATPLNRWTLQGSLDGADLHPERPIVHRGRERTALAAAA